MHLRRILALGTVGLVATAVLTACGFNYPTDRISQLSAGADYRQGNVDVLNAAVVAQADNAGTLLATFVNNTTQPAQLGSVTGANVTVETTPLTIPPKGLVNLADQGGYAVTGTFKVGDFLHLTFDFGNGDTASFEVPVVADANQWAGLDTATSTASPSASASS